MDHLEKVSQERPFSPLQNARTRGHSMKLKGGKFQRDKRKYFFTLCVIRLLNSLPQEVVKAKNVARFREGLDIYTTTGISRVRNEY